MDHQFWAKELFPTHMRLIFDATTVFVVDVFDKLTSVLFPFWEVFSGGGFSSRVWKFPKRSPLAPVDHIAVTPGRVGPRQLPGPNRGVTGGPSELGVLDGDAFFCA